MARLKKGSKAAKAWGARMKRLRNKPKKSRVSNPKPKRRRRTLARRRRRGRRGGMTIPLAPILGLAAGLSTSIEAATAGDYPRAINNAVSSYTGINTTTGQFELPLLLRGILPLTIGLLVHKFIGGPPLNFNAMLGRAKVPFIRI